MISKSSLIRYNNICKDITKVENYEEALNSSESWELHHRLETHTLSGKRRTKDISKSELISKKKYYHRPPEELIFLRTEDHVKLHHKGRKRPEETRNKMSATHTGVPRSEEFKRKIAKIRTGTHWSEEVRRKMSESRKRYLANR